MNLDTHVKELNARRLRIWNEARQFLDDAKKNNPTGAMNHEQRRKWDRMNAAIDALDNERDAFIAREKRESESASARYAFERQYGSAAVDDEADQLRSFLAGDGPRRLEVNIGNVREENRLRRQGASEDEIRTLVYDTGSSGSLVPTKLGRTLYEYMEASMSMMRAPCTVLNTDDGDPMNIPKLASHAIGTQVVAQGSLIAGTDPTFAQTPLNVFKYGEILAVASELIQDSAIDIVDFVARDVGRAIGRVVGKALAVGVGTTEPTGLMTGLAGGGAGSVTTGGSLVKPTYENLVDVQHAIADPYRTGGSAGWFIGDTPGTSTIAYLRKLRADVGGTSGPTLWSPSVTQGLAGGEPDTLLGYPVFPDPNIATFGSNARVLSFQAFNSYYIRAAGSFMFERSDDYQFANDLVNFRGKWRVGGALLDTKAGASLLQNV